MLNTTQKIIPHLAFEYVYSQAITYYIYGACMCIILIQNSCLS